MRILNQIFFIVVINCYSKCCVIKIFVIWISLIIAINYYWKYSELTIDVEYTFQMIAR
jgi:hypothetical protein